MKISDDDIISLWRTVRPSVAQNDVMTCEDPKENISTPTAELRHFTELVLDYAAEEHAQPCDVVSGICRVQDTGDYFDVDCAAWYPGDSDKACWKQRAWLDKDVNGIAVDSDIFFSPDSGSGYDLVHDVPDDIRVGLTAAVETAKRTVLEPRMRQEAAAAAARARVRRRESR